MQIRRKKDTRELLSYVSQNYKTLILELLSARARPSVPEKKETYVGCTLSSLCSRGVRQTAYLSARTAKSARLWIRGSVAETAAAKGERNGAKRNTRRERYGPPSLASDGGG